MANQQRKFEAGDELIKIKRNLPADLLQARNEEELNASDWSLRNACKPFEGSFQLSGKNPHSGALTSIT